MTTFLAVILGLAGFFLVITTPDTLGTDASLTIGLGLMGGSGFYWYYHYPIWWHFIPGSSDVHPLPRLILCYVVAFPLAFVINAAVKAEEAKKVVPADGPLSAFQTPQSK